MSVKAFKVSICDRKEISNFIETWHYSKNVNGLISDFCFKLENEKNELIGAMMFGKIAMRGVWKKYVDKESDLIELRRLCCIDETPKNTESYFIGKCLKWLRKNTDIKKIISYADQSFGHIGTIYKASNFKLLGQTAIGRVIIYNGKRYHDKTIRTKYKGKLKPFAEKIRLELVNGNAFYEKSKPKFIFIYDLR